MQLRLSAEDIVDALAGEPVDVPFVATYSFFGDLDAEQKADMERLEAIARTFIDIESFEISSKSSTVEVSVEGTLPLITPANGRDSKPGAWRLLVGPSELGIPGFDHRVWLAATSDFDAMEKDMRDVNFMSAPDEFNPTQIRLRADSGVALKLLAGGFQTGGDHVGLGVVDVEAGSSVTLNFGGGAYDETGATFLVQGLD
ncbi:MAG: hypothetical protein EOP22_05860 [Hyphomicrobiales bacterium]|nr:MAG: hypothetical protein EOP22_05860 [Hyphomicrobiales bacterium]